jgi:hypothetical protein
MQSLQQFTVTMTLCFTPEHLGEEKHYTSPPKCAADFANFAAWAVARYAPPYESASRAAPVEGAPGRIAMNHL